MRPSRWTPEQDAWVREHYPRTQPDDLRAMFLAEFGVDRGGTGIRSRAKVLGLRKADGYKAPHPRAWSAERAEWFKGFCPGHSEAEISAEHERLFGFPLTEGQIGNAKTRYKVKSGTHGGRFEKGHESWNKGRTWDELGIPPESQARSRSTCFKPGEVHDRPGGWLKPVGHERVDARDGYVCVKVRDSRVDGIQRNAPGHHNENYRLKHHVVWEQHNGPIPPHTMIVFADRDKRNFDPANLVAVPRSLWARISQMKMDYCDRETLEACMARAGLHAAMGRLKKNN